MELDVRQFGSAAGAAFMLASGGACAAGDVSLASCKGWNGTVVERDGIDTSRATMSGIITEAQPRR